MPIYKFDVSKQYFPNALKNKVRRMSQPKTVRGYQHRLTSNPMLRFLINLPIIKQTMQLTFYFGRKLITLIPNSNLKNGILTKEEDYGISKSRCTSCRHRCGSCPNISKS